MRIIESFLTNNSCYQAGRKITVRGLMLHSVGCPQPSAQAFARSWNSPSISACVHAFIDGLTGTVYQTLPWDHRGWHAGGSANDTHIGVEMCEPATIRYASGSAFTVSDYADARACVRRTYEVAVELFAELCKVYGLNPKTAILSHSEGYTRGVATNHGDPEHLWNGLGMGYTMDGFRTDVEAAMNGHKADGTGRATVIPILTGTQAADISRLSESEIVERLGRLCREDAKASSILASVSTAQAILESSYARSILATGGNNLFGMKLTLSGETWQGDVFTKETIEIYNGKVITIKADFRKYDCIEDSIADHSRYLSIDRYAGVKGCKDFQTAVSLIKAGGYATDPNYVTKLCAVRDKWRLGNLDEPVSEPEVKTLPYTVRVTASDLRIRTGPGVNWPWTGRYTGQGIFTITEQIGNWGFLKSGAGWICLDYAEVI